jgi:predicted RNA binding protein YcfA (HicA-like mRNA interferase family)
MTAHEVERILIRFGFVCVSQKGSHRKWRNFEERLLVIVPEHGGKTLPLGTLADILGKAGIPESEWRD